MKSKILYLYPFVHVNIKDNILLYNTLNNKIFITDKIIIKELLSKLFSSQNKVFVLESELLKNPEIDNFLVTIVDYNMGNISDYSKSQKLPLQFLNELKIQKDIDFLKNRNDRSIGEDILNYLKEVVVYLNSDCSLECKSCDYGYKQLTTCKKNNSKAEIDFSLVQRLINILNAKSVNTLHITGGNILKYGNLNNVISLLKERELSTIFYINAQNFTNGYKEIKILQLENSILNVIINDYKDLDCQNLVSLLNDNCKNWYITFLVEDEKHLEIIENVCTDLDQSKIEVKALYNKENTNFFKENVFVKKELLLEVKHDLHEIIQKQGLNINFFGTMIVDCNGEIYSSVNTKSLGNLKSTSIQEAIFEELKNNKCWRLLRQNVEPCSLCYYNLLCPEISNYEFEIGRFDLCDINL